MDIWGASEGRSGMSRLTRSSLNSALDSGFPLPGTAPAAVGTAGVDQPMGKLQSLSNEYKLQKSKLKTLSYICLHSPLQVPSLQSPALLAPSTERASPAPNKICPAHTLLPTHQAKIHLASIALYLTIVFVLSNLLLLELLSPVEIHRMKVNP